MKQLLLLMIAMFLSIALFSQENKKIKSKTQLKALTTSKSNVKTNNDKDAALKQKREKYLNQLSNIEFRKQNNIPENFPVYKDNGDLYNDTKQFDIAVKEWMQNNKEEYKKIKEIINF